MIAPLLAWYGARLHDEWEHRYGFKIETADNPGLIVTIDPGEDLGPDRILEDRHEMRPDRFPHPEAADAPTQQLIWDFRVRDGALVGFCAPGGRGQPDHAAGGPFERQIIGTR